MVSEGGVEGHRQCLGVVHLLELDLPALIVDSAWQAEIEVVPQQQGRVEADVACPSIVGHALRDRALGVRVVPSPIAEGHQIDLLDGTWMSRPDTQEQKGTEADEPEGSPRPAAAHS